MNKFLIIAFIFLISCKNSSNQTEIEELYKTELQQKNMLLNRLMQLQMNAHRESYRNYDLAFYGKIAHRIDDLYQLVDRKVLTQSGMRDVMIINYDKQVDLLNKFCDSVRQFKRFFLLDDLEQIKINSLNRTVFQSIQNDSLLYLMFTTNLKTELYRINLLNVPGCNLGSSSYRVQLYDFFITQAYTKNGSTYNVTIKNNYLFSDFNNHIYKLNFKSLKKIADNDTTLVNLPIKLTEVKGYHQTNNFTLEKGIYIFTTEIKFKMPLGDIKFAEMKFDFEVK